MRINTRVQNFENNYVHDVPLWLYHVYGKRIYYNVKIAASVHSAKSVIKL